MLSVVIVAWNEEQVLPRCLASVKGLADDIVVVVDKSTTDKTAQIAKQAKCRVFFHPHTGIVEPMRNFAISKATGDWILLLDADEEVSPSLKAQILDHVASDSCSYIRLPRKNIIFNKWITSDHWWPDYVYRLFKRGTVTWNDKIHSIPNLSGRGFDLPATESNALLHHNYQSISQFITRLNRYTDIQCQEIMASDTKFVWANIIEKPVAEFLRNYFARSGYKNGLHGLVLALLQGFSELVLYLKVWQSQGFAEQDVTSTELKTLVDKSTRDFSWWQQERSIQNSTSLIKPVKKVIRKLTSL